MYNIFIITINKFHKVMLLFKFDLKAVLKTEKLIIQSIIFNVIPSGSPIWILFIVMMNILYIGIYGVNSMELIYYIMKLEFLAMPDSE